MSVNKERVQLWVDALESGNFIQGTGGLETVYDDAGVVGPGTTKHCCLGVACRVAIANGLDIPVTGNYSISFDGGSGYMPASVGRWLGFAGAVYKIADGGLLDMDLNPAPDLIAWGMTASQCNDSMNLNFSQIADLIRYRYLDGDDD